MESEIISQTDLFFFLLSSFLIVSRAKCTAKRVELQGSGGDFEMTLNSSICEEIATRRVTIPFVLNFLKFLTK